MCNKQVARAKLFPTVSEVSELNSLTGLVIETVFWICSGYLSVFDFIHLFNQRELSAVQQVFSVCNDPFIHSATLLFSPTDKSLSPLSGIYPFMHLHALWSTFYVKAIMSYCQLVQIL